jgi:hypothetical protein
VGEARNKERKKAFKEELKKRRSPHIVLQKQFELFKYIIALFECGYNPIVF